MFCPNCGKEMPESAHFCGACGTNVDVKENEVPTAEPLYADSSIPAQKRGVSKKKFIKEEAKPSVKRASSFVWVAFVLAAVLLFANSFISIKQPIYEIPFVALTAPDMKDYFIDELDNADIDFDDAWDIMDELEGELDRREYKAVEKVLESGENLLRRQSLANFTDMIKDVRSALKLGLEDELDTTVGVYYSTDGMDEYLDIFGKVTAVIFGFAFLTAILLLFAAKGKITFLAVLSAIVSSVGGFALSGVGVTIMILLVHIVMISLIVKVNRAYKKGI